MNTAFCAVAVSSHWVPAPSCPTRVPTTACLAMRTNLLLGVPAAARWGLGPGVQGKPVLWVGILTPLLMDDAPTHRR